MNKDPRSPSIKRHLTGAAAEEVQKRLDDAQYGAVGDTPKRSSSALSATPGFVLPRIGFSSPAFWQVFALLNDPLSLSQPAPAGQTY
jgi:hypothetical protein